MAQVTIHVGGRERLEPAILKATPLGALPTEALVHLGASTIRGAGCCAAPFFSRSGASENATCPKTNVW